MESPITTENFKESIDVLAKIKDDWTFNALSVERRPTVVASLVKYATNDLFLSFHNKEHIEELNEDFYISLYSYIGLHPNRFCDWVKGRKTKALTVEVYDLKDLENSRFLKTVRRLADRNPGKITIVQTPVKKICSIVVADETGYVLSEDDGFIVCFNKPVVAKRMKEYNSAEFHDHQNFSSLSDEF